MYTAQAADCIAFLDSLEENSVDLILGSPPYADARTYGIDAVYGCQDWVDWMLQVTKAATRVSKGLVLWAVAGVQRELNYWPCCEGLAWEWWKQGGQQWRPCIWWKVDEDEGGTGIPGSGGKQWLRNDWEYILAFKKEGWLPWADNTVMGHAPVYAQVGGEMSNRTVDGQRSNARVGHGAKSRRDRWAGEPPDTASRGEQSLLDGSVEDMLDDPWNTASRGGQGIGGRKQDGRKKQGPMRVGAKDASGKTKRKRGAPMPKLANPGNCIIVKARVGGGHIGARVAHENEAPYPEKLCEFFIRSFCPPDGLVLDPFCGSGTTLAVAVRHGRRALGCDLRESQIALALKRCSEETRPLFGEL